MATMTKARKAEAEEAKERLRKLLPEGSTVYTVLRHVSKSGMSRRIDLYTIGEDRKPIFLTGWAACAMGDSWDRKNGGIRVPGCGMDMGFHLVYNLSATLYGATNRGGYALKQEWL